MLVDRLVHRNAHLLALRISEYLRMKPDRILVHWASEKVVGTSAGCRGSGRPLRLTGARGRGWVCR